VAIKVLNPDLGSALGTDRFAREIQVLGKLNHPHILPVLDSGEVNGLLYYVMPFVEGRSVRDKLAEDGHLPIEEALAITCDVADALGYAHGLGIIHRDIKPENILIHGGHAVVADFGIARLAQDTIGAEKLTVTGVSVGTVSYMAPEQAAGEKADARSDIYSLGCMLYELLAGEPPFTGPNAMAIMARHTMEMPRSIRVVRQSVPPEIEEAVLHALEKSPVDRFKSMEEFKQALLGQAGTVTAWRVSRGTPMRGTSPAEGRWPWTKTQLVGTLSAAGFVLLLLVAGAWKLLSRSGQSVMQAGSVGAIVGRRRTHGIADRQVGERASLARVVAQRRCRVALGSAGQHREGARRRHDRDRRSRSKR
jgi:serine/threonine-protein kinase